MKKLPAVLGTSLSYFLLATAAFAQTTGSIHGVVVGPDLAPLPKVAVEGKSPTFRDREPRSPTPRGASP